VTCLMLVTVGPTEAAAAAEPSGSFEGMLSRKHEWESTTKKSSARSVVVKFFNSMPFTIFNTNYFLFLGVFCVHF